LATVDFAVVVRFGAAGFAEVVRLRGVAGFAVVDGVAAVVAAPLAAAGAFGGVLRVVLRVADDAALRRGGAGGLGVSAMVMLRSDRFAPNA
jgi:hypothetical protein